MLMSVGNPQHFVDQRFITRRQRVELFLKVVVVEVDEVGEFDEVSFRAHFLLRGVLRAFD